MRYSEFRKMQEWPGIPAFPRDSGYAGMSRNSALHLFKLDKWSLSHPWDISNSGIGRNDQEFLHFLVIPDMHKFRNSALISNRSFKIIISLFSISFEFWNYPEWPGIGCWELDLKGTTNQEFLVVVCICGKGSKAMQECVTFGNRKYSRRND